MNIEFAREWLLTLQLHDLLPKPLYDIVDAVYSNAVSLAERYPSVTEFSATDLFASLNLQSILPPLISILTIYFALLSLYRTTTFFVRSTIFLVKWGAMIGAAGATLGYIANFVSPESFGMFNQGNSAARWKRSNPSRSAKPRVWESFEQQQQWREAEENPYAMDAGNFAREMVEKIVDATQQAAGQGGWWGALTGMVAETVMGEEPTTSGKGKRRRKDGKGKAKSR